MCFLGDTWASTVLSSPLDLSTSPSVWLREGQMWTETTQQPQGMTGLALPSFSGEEVDENWPKGGGVCYGGCPGRAQDRLPPGA